jgi:hypothetical protein
VREEKTMTTREEMAERLVSFEARVTRVEAVTMEQAHAVGGLDAEMDAVNRARLLWFKDTTPATLAGRVDAVEALSEAIGKRIEELRGEQSKG